MAEYDLNASEADVIKDLIEGKGWDFLRMSNVYTGEYGIRTWWNFYTDGWHDLWNLYLLELGEIYDNLSTVRKTYTPLTVDVDEIGNAFGNKEYFLYKFLLLKPDRVEWSENLKPFENKTTEDLFDIRVLKAGEVCNPNIPSGLFYITPKESIDFSDDHTFFKTKSLKERFRIYDTREECGTLDVYTSFITDDISELNSAVRYISQYTCMGCGALPKNSKGKHIIWKPRDWWIEHLCRDCARERCYYLRRALRSSETAPADIPIPALMKERFEKIVDHSIPWVHESPNSLEKKILSKLEM